MTWLLMILFLRYSTRCSSQTALWYLKHCIISTRGYNCEVPLPESQYPETPCDAFHRAHAIFYQSKRAFARIPQNCIINALVARLHRVRNCYPSLTVIKILELSSLRCLIIRQDRQNCRCIFIGHTIMGHHSHLHGLL